jgi:hypothetical protein
MILMFVALAGCGSSRPEGTYVTLEQFDQINIGDTWDNVVNLCGKPLKVLTRAGSGISEEVVYLWPGKAYDDDGSSLVVAFKYGQVFFKKENGLSLR